MNDAIKFLYALSQALATTVLYNREHPAAARAMSQLSDALHQLLAIDAHPVFLFLGGAPVYNGRALQEMRDWQQAHRLSDAGVQRLEFDAAASAESVAELVVQLGIRLAGDGEPMTVERTLPGIAFGKVAVQALDDVVVESDTAGAPVLEVRVDLAEELDAMVYVLAEAARGNVARAEAETIVHVLAAMVDPRRLCQAAWLGEEDRSAALHAINCSLLALSVAAAAGLDRQGAHRIGVAVLLHDVGMTRLAGSHPFVPHLRQLDGDGSRQHPLLGAQLLLRAGGAGVVLAAVVSAQHHRAFATATDEHPLHWAARLTHAASAFVDLRAAAGQLSTATIDAMAALVAGSGEQFDPEIVSFIEGVVRGS